MVRLTGGDIISWFFVCLTIVTHLMCQYTMFQFSRMPVPCARTPHPLDHETASKVETAERVQESNIITPIVTCMPVLRNCTRLAAALREANPHVLAQAQVFEITEQLSRFTIVHNAFVHAFDQLNPSSTVKVRQFRHFMAIFSLVVGSSVTCPHDTALLLLLDDDVLPCPDAMSWILVLSAWMRDFDALAAVRVAAGTSGLLLRCGRLRTIHEALSNLPDAQITAIDDMLDVHLHTRSGANAHYLQFHHTLFSHTDDRPSLILQRQAWQTSSLLHTCYSPLQWNRLGASTDSCDTRLFWPCINLHGLPPIPFVDPLASHSTRSVCSQYTTVNREWMFLLAAPGYSCNQACNLQAFACDPAGLIVANLPNHVQAIARSPVGCELSHKLAAPHFEGGLCFTRATGCLPGTLDEFCEHADSVAARICPCARSI